MEISDLKVEVEKVETAIVHMINKLNYETGVQVQSIDLTSFTSQTKTGVTCTTITDVKLTMTL
jgi:hypothetical protein